MKLTKMLMCGAVVVLGTLGLTAKAGLPTGFESVKVSATLLGQGENKIEKMKITSDDILELIDTEYNTSFSKQDGGSGFQLVSSGFDENDLEVLDKNGNVVLANASSHGSSSTNDYNLFIEPFSAPFQTWVDTEDNHDNFNFTIANVSFDYNSSDDNDSFNLVGSATDKLSYETDDESYSVKNGQGTFDFEDADVFGVYGDVFGVVTDLSISGSGKDIEPFDD